MNLDSLDPHWVRNWAADVTVHLQSVMSAFDGDDPYPPGRNEIVPVGSDQRGLETLRAHPGTPPDLITFYSVIDEVLMGAFANAFFIHPPSHVIRQVVGDPIVLDDGKRHDLRQQPRRNLYAMGPDNKVYRSHDAALNGDYTPIATDLRDFLEQLRDAVAHYAITPTPGDW
ncbi:hypothetical protein [Embleya sp. NPDC001921]